MSETKWTPGRWEITEWRDEEEDMAGFRVAINDYLVPACTYEGEYEEAKANVTLWSAAPELYAALDMILHRYVGLVNCGDCGNWNPEEEPQVMMARAALAKARGE